MPEAEPSKGRICAGASAMTVSETEHTPFLQPAAVCLEQDKSCADHTKFLVDAVPRREVRVRPAAGGKPARA